MTTAIIERYEGCATQSDELGCANLWPFLDLEPGMTVLDLGSGRGHTAYRLSQQVGETGSVIGLDVTPGMIEQASKAFSSPNIRFIAGDMTCLPVKSRHVDRVLSNCAINHVRDKRAVFSEIYRVLKPNGYFLIGDVMSMDDLPESVSCDPRNVAACWGGAVPRSAYLHDLRQVGFAQVDILNERRYSKEGYAMESLILKGVKSLC